MSIPLGDGDLCGYLKPTTRRDTATLLEEWAYNQPWHSETQRRHAYHGFLHYYNHHRSHGALGWATPAQTLNQLTRDNLPEDHT